MEVTVLFVDIAREEGGRVRVTSPRVGRWSSPPHDGAVVGPGSLVGFLRQLNHRYELRLPDGIAGRVDSVARGRVLSVEHGRTLFGLTPLLEEDQRDLEHRHPAPGAAGEKGLADGTRSIVSPSDGVYYGRPSPDVPPFVAVGSRVRAGQPVGLVEVMKTFNQILYGGPGLPDEVEVLEVRCRDGDEIQAGQVLMIVR